MFDNCEKTLYIIMKFVKYKYRFYSSDEHLLSILTISNTKSDLDSKRILNVLSSITAFVKCISYSFAYFFLILNILQQTKLIIIYICFSLSSSAFTCK